MESVYVVERHDPLIAETSIEGVWRARVPAWEHVMEALTDEKVRIETEESSSRDATDTTERLKIEEFFTNPDSGQHCYALTDQDGDSFLNFYITKVQFHE